MDDSDLLLLDGNVYSNILSTGNMTWQHMQALLDTHGGMW